MRHLTPGQAEKLRALTIDFILDLRAAHFRSRKRDPLGHWDLLLNRAKGLSYRADSVAKWTTSMLDALVGEAPDLRLSRSITTLSDEVATTDTFYAWRQLVRTETAYLISRAREIADQRKDEREAREAAEAEAGA